MLLLELKLGESITLVDKDANQELGHIRRITPHPPNQPKAVLGFDFPSHIQIIRDKLVLGKDTENAKKQPA